jgi:hypothetical protein
MEDMTDARVYVKTEHSPHDIPSSACGNLTLSDCHDPRTLLCLVSYLCFCLPFVVLCPLFSLVTPARNRFISMSPRVVEVEVRWSFD